MSLAAHAPACGFLPHPRRRQRQSGRSLCDGHRFFISRASFGRRYTDVSMCSAICIDASRTFPSAGEVSCAALFPRKRVLCRYSRLRLGQQSADYEVVDLQL